jgi:hypothetical protein
MLNMPVSRVVHCRPLAVATALAACLFVVTVAPAAAQVYEAVGTRAQGMGGAFVAVADDATSTWWNPAGLATGAFLSLIVEHGTSDFPNETTVGPAERQATNNFAIAFPSLGLSYYHLRISEIAPTAPTATQAAGRQDEGTVVRLSTVEISQFGSSVGQSFGRHLVVATTVKLVRAGRSLGATTAPGDLLGAASDLDVDTTSGGDFDIGAMAALGHLRLGASAKHLLEPKFGDGDRLVLRRQSRAGAAWTVSSPGLIGTVTAAFDADILKTESVLGDRRNIAAGVETWLKGKSVGLRAGFNMSTIGDKRTIGTLGGSVSARGKMHLNGAWLYGADKTRSGWSAGISMTY